MAVVTIDSYSSANIDTGIPIYSNASTETGAVGQAFTCSSSYSVQSITFYLKRYGSPTGTITAAIYAHTGTYGTTSRPTGSPICVSDTTVEASDVGTSGYVGWKFYFTTSENRQLSPDTKYVATISYSNGDGNNFIYVGVDNSSPTHSGNSSVLKSGTLWLQASADAAFTVLGDEEGPTVTTQNCSSVTHNSAVGNGNITATGGVNITRRGFCYMTGTSGDPTTANSTVYDDGTFGTGAYTKAITGLSQGTAYRVRAYAVNSIGTRYGSTVQVTTLTTPTVTTQAASSVTYNSATGNGNITATGGASVTRRGFCYMAATNGDPTVANSTVYDDGTFGTGAYTKGITGLNAETGYRVRAYAINSVGTSYGSTVQLTTQGANSPVVSTTTTSRLDRKCVIFGGNVTDQGSQAVTERGVYYGTDEFSQTNKLVSSSGLGTYSIFLSGLTPNTKYYFKAFATSSIGTAYGDVLSFTTGNSLAATDKTALPPFNRA